MNNPIIKGLQEAFYMIFSFDPGLYDIIFRSIWVSCTAVLIASCVQMPIGVWLGLKPFKGKKLFSRFLYASMSVPSVVVGLVVMMLLSRKGPFGFAELLYTPTAMIIAQAVLVSPLILGLTYHAVKQRGPKIEMEGRLLGATGQDIVVLIMREMSGDMWMNVVAAFSRAISEVGAVMLVGGNILGETRVMTTSIALMNRMGNYSSAIALGVVLLLISLTVNSLIYRE